MGPILRTCGVTSESIPVKYSRAPHDVGRNAPHARVIDMRRQILTSQLDRFETRARLVGKIVISNFLVLPPRIERLVEIAAKRSAPWANHSQMIKIEPAMAQFVARPQWKPLAVQRWLV